MTDDRPPQPPGTPDAPEPATAGASSPPPADDLPPTPPGADTTDPGAGAYGEQQSAPLHAFAVRHGLIRPAHGRVFAGVCGAFGRATNTDPVLWRIVLAVLTFFGGVGLVVYLIGWLTLPSEGDTGAPVEAVLGRGRSSTPTVVTVIVACIVLLTLAAFLGGRAEPGVFIVLLLLGGGYLLLRERGKITGPPPAYPPTPGYPPAPGYPVTPPPPAGYYPPTSQGATMSSPATATTPLAPPPPGAPPRAPFAPHGPYGPPPVPPTWNRPVPTPPTPKPPRSRLGGLVISVLLLVLGVVALIDLADNSVPGEVYVAAALATVGLGLVIGAWIGRARGLIALGIVLSLGLGLTAGVDRVHNDDWGHMGNIEWRPHNVAEIEDHYRQGAGDTRLDLSNVDFAGQDVTTRLTTRAGNVTIILPDKVDAVVNAKVFAGNAEVLGEQWEGLFNPKRTVTDLDTDGAGGGKITIVVEVSAGNLEVHR
ncbi:hypothetical protein GCM10009682_04320 [Luedemannella flava]|uniref:PspC domain-containing protein n=1 Tax=Luedemannella flava TaxID=349316 RepID=A0ABN2LEG7_9ACTN